MCIIENENSTLAKDWRLKKFTECCSLNKVRRWNRSNVLPSEKQHIYISISRAGLHQYNLVLCYNVQNRARISVECLGILCQFPNNDIDITWVLIMYVGIIEIVDFTILLRQPLPSILRIVFSIFYWLYFIDNTRLVCLC